MTRSRRCLAALVDAIKADVAELTHDGNALCVALWQEADADAGYVIHRDGRMLGVGGYQHGFDHVDELMEEPANEDVARACRHEAGRILADLTALDAEQGELLEKGLPHAFGADWQAVANVIGQGRADLAAWFDLATSRPGKLVVQGREDDTDEITVMTDIVAGRLRRQVDGSLSWEAQTILRAGEKAMGGVVRHGEQPSHAQVYVPGQGLEPGGVVCLEAGEFTTPPPVRHAKPPGCGGR